MARGSSDVRRVRFDGGADEQACKRQRRCKAREAQRQTGETRPNRERFCGVQEEWIKRKAKQRGITWIPDGLQTSRTQLRVLVGPFSRLFDGCRGCRGCCGCCGYLVGLMAPGTAPTAGQQAWKGGGNPLDRSIRTVKRTVEPPAFACMCLNSELLGWRLSYRLLSGHHRFILATRLPASPLLVPAPMPLPAI